jgi:hypothetical protein
MGSRQVFNFPQKKYKEIFWNGEEVKNKNKHIKTNDFNIIQSKHIN